MAFCIDKKTVAGGMAMVAIIEELDKNKKVTPSKLKKALKKAIQEYSNYAEFDTDAQFDLTPGISSFIGWLNKKKLLSPKITPSLPSVLLEELVSEPVKKTEQEKVEKIEEELEETEETDAELGKNAAIVKIEQEEGNDQRLLSLSFTEGDTLSSINLNEKLVSDLQPNELIRKLNELRFNNDSDLHQSFYQFFKQTIFNATILDSENKRIIDDSDVDGNIKSILKSAPSKKEVDVIVTKLGEDQPLTQQEKTDYFKFIISTDIDALIKAYPTVGGILSKQAGVYKNKLASHIRSNSFKQEAIDFNEEATDLFKFIVDTIPVGNRYIVYEDLVSASIKLRNKNFERTYNFQEFISAALNGPYPSETTDNEKSTIKAFANYVKDIAEIDNPDARMLAHALVNTATTPSLLRLGFEKIINNELKFLIEGEKTTSTSSRISQYAAIVATNFDNIIGNPESILSRKDDGNMKTAISVLIPTITGGLTAEDLYSYISQVENNFLSIKGQVTKETKKRFDKVVKDYASYVAFFKIIKNLKGTKEEIIGKIDQLLIDSPLNIEDKSGESFYDLLALKETNPSDFYRVLDTAYNPQNLVKNFTDLIDLVQTVLDSAEMNTPRMTQIDILGNQSAKVTLHNVIADINSRVKRSGNNNLFKNNIFSKNLVSERFKRSGVSGYTESKSHAQMKHTDNAIAQMIYEFAALHDTSEISYFTPTTFEAKNTEYGFGVKRNELVNITTYDGKELTLNPFNQENSFNDTIDYLWETNKSYYLNLRDNILRDINALTGQEVTLETIPENLKELAVILNDQRIQQGLEPIKIVNNIHYNNDSIIESIKKYQKAKPSNYYSNAKESFAKYLIENNIRFSDDMAFNYNVGDEFIETSFSFAEKRDVEYHKAAIETKEGIKLHPLAEKFFWEWNIVHDHFEQFVTGVSEQYVKKTFHKEFSNLTEQIKRNGTAVATVHPYMTGLDDGIADYDKFVIVEDPKAIFNTITGKDLRPDIYDGAGNSTLLSMLEKQVSLGGRFGQNVGVHHKSVNNGMDERNGTVSVEKWNDFAMTHEFLRNSRDLTGMSINGLNFYDVNRKLLNSIKFQFNPAVEGFTQQDLDEYQTRYYDSETNTVKEGKLDLNKTYNSMWEMYEDLGGVYTVLPSDEGEIEHNGRLYKYASLNDKYYAGKMIHPAHILHDLKTKHFQKVLRNLTGIDKPLMLYSIGEIKANLPAIIQAKKQSIKEKHLSTLAFGSGIKSGAGNVMTLEQARTMDNFVYTEHSTANRGVQVNTEKELEDKTLSASTQAYSAIAFGGFNTQTVDNTYKVLEVLSLNKLEEELVNALETNDIRILREIAANKIKEALSSRSSISSLAENIIEEFKTRLDQLPIDHKQLFGVVANTLNSYMTNEGIRSKMSGSQYVIRPAHHINVFVDSTGRELVLGTNKDIDFLSRHLAKEAERLNINNLRALNPISSIEFENFTSTEYYKDIRAYIISKLKTRRLKPAKVYYYDNGQRIDIHLHPDIVALKTLINNNGSKEEILALNQKVERFLLELKKNRKTGNIYYDTNNNPVLETEPGEVIVPFAAFSKFKDYGVTSSMSIQQVREQLKSAPETVRVSFEEQLKNLTMRIPLQSLASVMYNEVVAFQTDDPTTIMISDQHQALTGGDFDVDKSNFNKYFLDDDAELERWFKGMDLLDSESWNVNAETVVRDLLNKDINTNGAINYVLYSMIQTADDPSTIQTRETAVSTDNIDEVVNTSIKKDIDQKLLKNDPSTFWRKKEGNMVTKQTVGVFATSIKALAAIHYSYHQALEQLLTETDSNVRADLIKKMQIPSITINGKKYDNIANLNYNEFTSLVNQLEESADTFNAVFEIINEVFNNKATTKEELLEYIDTLQIKDKAYDILGELLNAAVDGAKDPKLDKINADISVASIYAYSAVLGVPIQEIGKLMVDPIIDVVIQISAKSPFSFSTYRSVDGVAEQALNVISLLNQKGQSGKTFKTLILEKIKEINGKRDADDQLKFSTEYFDEIQDSLEGSITWLAKSFITKEKITKNTSRDQLLKKLNIDERFKDEVADAIESEIETIIDIPLDTKSSSRKLASNISYHLFLNNIMDKLNTNAMVDFLREFKSRKVVEAPESAVQKLSNFIDVYRASQSFKILGQTLGINQGLGSNEYKIFSFKNRVESFIEKNKKFDEDDRTKHPSITERFDMLRFIESLNQNGDYHKEWINIYDDIIKPSSGGVNMLWVFATNPYFRGQFNMLFKADQWGKSISYKLKNLDSLINWLDTNKILLRRDIQESDIKRLFNVMDEIAVNNHFTETPIELSLARSTGIKIFKGDRYTTTNKRKINLSKIEDRAIFVEWMNNIFIPTLVSNANNRKTSLYGNQFLKKLVLNNTRPDSFGNRKLKWELIFDPTNIKTERRLIEQESIRKGLEQLSAGTLTIQGQEYDPVYLFTLYNRLVNLDASNSESFTQYLSSFETTRALNNKFFEFLSNAKDTLNISDYLNTYQDNLPALLGKYNLIKYVPEFLEELQSQNYDLYATKIDGKTIIKYKGSPYIIPIDTPIISLDQTEGLNILGLDSSKTTDNFKVFELMQKLIQDKIIVDC